MSILYSNKLSFEFDVGVIEKYDKINNIISTTGKSINVGKVKRYSRHLYSPTATTYNNCSHGHESTSRKIDLNTLKSPDQRIACSKSLLQQTRNTTRAKRNICKRIAHSQPKNTHSGGYENSDPNFSRLPPVEMEENTKDFNMKIREIVRPNCLELSNEASGR
ncbi:unnamed protein product [Owenia fusiformis]|uniref:Uncharacterized protein n=1 Tax=Owenia fusiformis TaxID=6347 RepID=A0A8J1UBN4_OWEFU|nr:unnamed protein product [Owenia fusiformis]